MQKHFIRNGKTYFKNYRKVKPGSIVGERILGVKSVYMNKLMFFVPNKKKAKSPRRFCDCYQNQKYSFSHKEQLVLHAADEESFSESKNKTKLEWENHIIPRSDLGWSSNEEEIDLRILNISKNFVNQFKILQFLN